MNKTLYNSNIWEQLFQFSSQYPINWSGYEKEFEIRKLELEKLDAEEIREKKLDFEKKYMTDHQISKSWMENQYRLFIWFLFTYSKLLSVRPELFSHIQWSVVADCFCKEPLFCQYFYLSSKKIKSPEWREEEDNFIEKMMRTALNKKWTEIGLELYIRSGGVFFRKPKSIRERWLSHLNPNIKKDEWGIKQDLLLVRNIKEKGKKWSRIAKIFGNRTQHTIKNRYNQLLTKYLKDQRQLKFQKEGTENYKLETIQFQLLKAEKNEKRPKSNSTLPENLESQPFAQIVAKVEQVEDLQKSFKFNPIILALPQTNVPREELH